MMNIEHILNQISLEDKIALCSGLDFWHTKEMTKYKIPSIMMADGPHGLRKQVNAADMLGINESIPATCFPTAVSTGCSWDHELLVKIGEAIGKEALANDISLVLGPGANIKRNPLCGRNFEYYSEDPYLTGKMASGLIKGMESVGAGSSLKHFAFNNQEFKRFSSDSIMDERTMREIYLTGFEIAVQEGKPSTVMSSYNKINGEHCSESKLLLTDILRNEWGFKGMVLTDWGGMSDRIKSFMAGCDLCMPGGSAYMEKEAVEAVNNHILDEKYITQSAHRILNMVHHSVNTASNMKVDMEAHHMLARKAAEESAVLLKNEGNLLPLSDQKDIVFIGHMAKEIRYQGSGSSHINPWKLVNVTQAYPSIPFTEGYDSDGNTTEAMLLKAQDAAKQAQVAVVFAGLPSAYESEGFDRDHMKMPKGHIQLIEAVANVNSNTVVVLMCGSAVELPWEHKVQSILYMGLPGQAGGEAIVNLLFGKSIPCGKLAESWPITYEDCVCSTYYAGNKKDAHYREGIYVGYRYYETSGTKVRYSFGHGLSYTSFSYSDLQMKDHNITVNVTNTGKYTGKEIVQLYITPPQEGMFRPIKELKAFAKVELQPNETKNVTLQLHDRSFAIWDNGWVVPAGTYIISLGGSSKNLPVSCTIIKNTEVPLTSKNIPSWYSNPKGHPSHEDWEHMMGRNILETPLKKGAFTMDNSVKEMKDYSFIMKIMYIAVENTIAKGFNGKKDYSNPEFRMMINAAADASLSGMKISGGLKNYVLEGMLSIANGHFLKGIKLMLKKY